MAPNTGHDLDTLGSLLDKSLIRRRPGSERFMMLETIREYASECLDASGRAAASRNRGEPAPVRSAGGIRQLEVLDPHHEDDIVPVILEEPDHHRALTVALHVGHRFDHAEWGANPTCRYSVGDPRPEAFHLWSI
jgi:hypothetical protein